MLNLCCMHQLPSAPTSPPCAVKPAGNEQCRSTRLMLTVTPEQQQQVQQGCAQEQHIRSPNGRCTSWLPRLGSAVPCGSAICA